jgi:hypothetical protein
MTAGPVPLIAGRRVGAARGWVVLRADHVAYFFLGSAVRGSERVIEATWTGETISDPRGGPVQHVLDAGAVYARTVKGGLFRTGFSSLSDALRQLDPSRFVAVHRLAVANVDRIVQVDPEMHLTRVGLLVGSEVEFLRVSRRPLKSLRRLIGGFPKRLDRVQHPT